MGGSGLGVVCRNVCLVSAWSMSYISLTIIRLCIHTSVCCSHALCSVLVPDPKPTPACITPVSMLGRKDKVHIPKDSLQLIQTCYNYQNFSFGQEAEGDKWQHSRLVCLPVILEAIYAEIIKISHVVKRQRVISVPFQLEIYMRR